jgi:DNA gyrase subunit B
MSNQLSPLEAVRKRPGMYVGDTEDGTGLANMIWELVANALDEHLAGRCSRISVEVREDGAISVDDDGRGFPLLDRDGGSFVERALTRLHDTPTLDGHAPHEHVGLHGVGLFPVNALSSWLVVEVFSDGRHHEQRFGRGVATTSMRDVGPTDRRGTRVTFAPDPTIFRDTWLDAGRVGRRLREISWLLPALTLELNDQRKNRFHEATGLRAFLGPLREDGVGTLLVDETQGRIRVEVAARWHAHSWDRIESFANIMRTTSGGTHVRGLLTGLIGGLRAVAPDACRRKGSEQLTKAVSRGLDAVVCVRLNDPKFGQPNLSELLTPEVEGAVRDRVSTAFATFLRDHETLLGRLRSALARPE